ncbi:MAG: class I SAM-dependent methyltransferase [Terriglobales bacterium]
MGTPESTESTPSAWQGAAYDAVASVQEQWGRAVIARNAWRGDEIVLDAGCGSGRLMPALAERIPHGRLVGLDRDGSMIETARQRLRAAPLPAPAELLVGDLAALELTPLAAASFDVVFSNAALHWVRDRIRVFAGIVRLLVPGGRFTAQFGGQGNIQRIRAAIYRTLKDLGLPTQYDEEYAFPTPEQTTEQLKICGFRQVRVWREDALTEFASEAAFLQFTEVVVLRPLRASLPPAAWAPFLAAFPARVRALLGGWRMDYVRQNLEALR